MKKIKFLLIIFGVSCLLGSDIMAAGLGSKLAGRILLQVEDHGQAWYVEPQSQERIFLGRPMDAWLVMREFGLGVSEADYKQFMKTVPDKLAGRILLRVEAHGEAYFVSPLDLTLHYLGKPIDAWQIMRDLGLGISNDDLADIGIKNNYNEKDYQANKIREDTASKLQEDVNSQIIVSDLIVDNVTASSAKINFILNQAVQTLYCDYGTVSGSYNHHVAIAHQITASNMPYEVKLNNLIAQTKYYFRIRIIDEQLATTSPEFSLITNKKLSIFVLANNKKISNTTVKNSYPQIAEGVNDFGLLWWDGYASFSRFNPDTQILAKVKHFAGANPGDVAFANNNYALAWEKNCQIYADVVNDLNNSLNNSRSIVSRIGEACPTNICLSSDNQDFALVWTSATSDEQANLYLKIFNNKAITINQEILLSAQVDLSVAPTIVWTGNNYLVVWADRIDQELSIKSVLVNSIGQMIGNVQIIDSQVSVNSDFSLLIDGNGIYKLFYMDNTGEQSRIIVKTFSFDVDDAVQLDNSLMIALNMIVASKVKLNVVRNGDNYAISFVYNGQIYFQELDNNLEYNSVLVTLLADDNIQVSQSELFVANGKYNLFWHENSLLEKVLYFGIIQ